MPMKPTTDELVRLVMSDYESFKEALDPLRSRWFEYLMIYRNTPQRSVDPGRTYSSIPLGMENVDVFAAYLTSVLMGSDGVNIDLDATSFLSENMIRATRKLIKAQSNKIGMRLHTINVCRDIGIFGTAFTKSFLADRKINIKREEPIQLEIDGQTIDLGDDYKHTVTKEVQSYFGPDMSKPSVFDVFWDPSMQDIDDPLAFIHRVRIPLSELEAGAKDGTYESDAVEDIRLGLMLDDDPTRWSLVTRELETDDLKRRLKSMRGVNQSMGAAHIECLEWQGPLDWDGNGQSETCVLLVGPNKTLLRKDKLSYLDGKKTWVVGRIFPQDGDLHGMGLIEKSYHPIKAANAMHNAKLAHIRQNMFPNTLISDKIDQSELLGIPNGVLTVPMNALANRPISDHIHVLQPNPINPDLWSLEDEQKEFVRQSVGLDTIQAGRQPSQKATATRDNLVAQNASVRSGAVTVMIEDSWQRPLIRKFAMINHQFLRKQRVIKMIGMDGFWWPDDVNVDDIASEVNIICLGSTREMNKEVRLAQLRELLQTVGPLPQASWAITPLLMQIFREINPANLEELELAGQEYQRQFEEYQQYMMQMRQMPLTAGQGTGGQPQLSPQQSTTNSTDVMQQMSQTAA